MVIVLLYFTFLTRVLFFFVTSLVKIVKLKVEPTPSVLFSQIRPFINSTSALDIASPNPVPPNFFSIELSACEKEVKIDFSQEIIETSEGAEIALNFTKAEGTEAIVKGINHTLENYIINQINLSEHDARDVNLYDPLAKFNYN